MLRVAVLVSGGGTNLQALMDAIHQGQLPNVELVAVVSNKAGIYALERAKQGNIPSYVIQRKDHSSLESFQSKFEQTLYEINPDLIVLAGFLMILPSSLIERFRNRIINIHPSLIPSFCGEGYYGLKVHQAVLERGVKVTGATVHIVDEGCDTGPILLQKPVLVQPGDTPETLQRRVMEEAEWELLPKAVSMFADSQGGII